MVFKCNSCGAVFNNPDVSYDRHSEVDLHQYEKYDCCPVCGSIDFERKQMCALCKEDVAEDDYCIACSEEISRMVEQVIDLIRNKFDVDYEKALDILGSEIERRI